MVVGYALSSEEHGPVSLVRYARRAEEVGFGLLTISDHYHPWIDRQGHSPFVWSVLGAIAESTERVPWGPIRGAFSASTRARCYPTFTTVEGEGRCG